MINWKIECSPKINFIHLYLFVSLVSTVLLHTIWMLTNFRCFQYIKQKYLQICIIQTNVLLVERKSFTLLYHIYILPTQSKHTTFFSSLLFKSENDQKWCCLLITKYNWLLTKAIINLLAIFHLHRKLWVLIDAQLTKIAHHICM